MSSGVRLDGQLSMDDHVASVCRLTLVLLSAIRQLHTIRSMLTKETTIVTLIHAFISSGLDYCNSLLYGFSSTLLRRQKSIQNAAARLVTGAKKLDHIPPVLRTRTLLAADPPAHALRTSYHSWCTSACTMLHHCLSQQRLCTGIIIDRETTTAFLCQRHSGVTVSGQEMSVLGRRAFRVCGPATWNALPTELRTATVSFDTFGKQQLLKTCLFESAY